MTTAFAPPTRAQNREDGAPAEALGAGDAVYASVWGPASIYFNPAGLLRVPTVMFEAAYSYLEGKDGHGFGISGMDSKTNSLAAIGVAYSYITGAPHGVDRDGHQFRLGLGTGYQSGDVGLYAGVGGRYLNLTIGSDDDKTPTEHDDVDHWTIDAGLILDFAHVIKLGVVGQNLIDMKTTEAPRGLGVGLSFLFNTIEVGADIDIDLTGELESVKQYAFGIDYGFGEVFHARAGFQVDQLHDEERATFGLGYSTPDLAIDVGYATAFSEPTDMVVSVSLRFMPSIQ
ncbi:MAG: hypothetical protein U1F43_14230 [Myxococcota bacterium]